MRLRIPSWAVEGLLVVLTVFGPFAFGGVEPWSRATIEVLALLLALLCFLKGRPAATSVGAYFWVFPAAVAVLGYIQLTTVVLPGGPYPLRPFTATPYETQASIMLWVVYAAVMWSVPRIVTAHDCARRYARVLFGVGLVLAGLGLLQMGGGGDRLYWLRYAPRVSSFGSYYNRDHAANILLMSLAMGVGLFISRGGSRLKIENGVYSRTPLLAGLFIVIAGLFACSSEASFIAIPLSGAAVAFLGADFARSARHRRWRAAAALAGAALTIFFAYHHVSASADAGSLIDRSVMGRLSIYGDAWRWWRHSPLFGTGLGGFEAIYPSYQDLGLLGTAAHAHSDWIEFALETGLLGLVSGIGVFMFALSVITRTWREARSSEMRALIGGGLAAITAFAAHSLFEFSFQIPGNAVMFFALLGFLLSAPSWADKSASYEDEKRPSAGTALLAAAYCVVLMRAAVVPAAASWQAARPGDAVERVVSLAQAVSLDANPVFAKRLSDAAYSAAGEGARPDYSFLRISLRYALAAAERRPFSTDSLYLAGAVLHRLKRAEDGRDYLRRSNAVRFSRFEPRRETVARRREKKIDVLRELNLAPAKTEKR